MVWMYWKEVRDKFLQPIDECDFIIYKYKTYKLAGYVIDDFDYVKKGDKIYSTKNSHHVIVVMNWAHGAKKMFMYKLFKNNISKINL